MWAASYNGVHLINKKYGTLLSENDLDELITVIIFFQSSWFFIMLALVSLQQTRIPVYCYIDTGLIT